MNLLNIVEVLSMLQIIDVSWLMSISDSSKIELVVLVSVLAKVTRVSWHIEVDTSIELLVDSGSCSLGE